jgi:hypothetical protein
MNVRIVSHEGQRTVGAGDSGWRVMVVVLLLRFRMTGAELSSIAPGTRPPQDRNEQKLTLEMAERKMKPSNGTAGSGKLPTAPTAGTWD